MDRELPTNLIRKKKLKKYAGIAAIIIMVIVSLLGFRSILGSSVNHSMIRTAVADRGPIEATVTASGVVMPEDEQVITSPIQSKIDQIIHKAGDNIKAGEAILQLNLEFVLIALDKLKAELDLKKNQKSQLNLKLERSRIDLQAAYDIKELQTNAIAAKLEQEKHLLDIGAGTQVSLNQAELNLDVSRRELQQLKNQIDNQQKSLEADLRELELQTIIQEKNIAELSRQIELAEARAERDGVITWVNDKIGATVNKGDVIARVADLSSFRVDGSISDIHTGKLQIGSPVNVKIGETYLRGEIIGIKPTIENGIITFTVKLDDKTNGLLRSNLRVDIYVVTSFIADVVRVANGPFVNGSGPQDIFIVKGDIAIRRRVTVGASNFDYVEIKNDVLPGDEIIISDMSDYIHRSEVKIKNK